MRRALLLLLLAFALTSFAYSVVVPPFETPDEVQHYGFARHVAAGNGLPVQGATATGPWEHEGSQAPLYYMIAGLLTRWIPQDDFDAIAVRNPRANIGNPLYPGNKNYMLYSSVNHPLVGSNLALHIGRWFSLVLGIITVAASYGFARRYSSARAGLALTAATIVAIIPQFAFLSGSFTNDALVTAASAVTLFWLGVLVARAADEPVRWYEWGALGMLLAVAALSKLQGLGLFALAALAGLGMAWQRRDWRLPLRALLPVALPPIVLAGWWYLRNYRLYGDWIGRGFLLEQNGLRAGGMSFSDWWLEFRGLRYSFWGLFGWFNILLPDWVYVVLDVFSAVAFIGAMVALGMRLRHGGAALRADRAARVLLLALVWALLSLALLVAWTLTATASQGRLMFPALGALALVFVVGMDFWVTLLPARARGAARFAIWGGLFTLLAGCSIYALAVLLPRSYRAAAPIGALPEAASVAGFTYQTEAPIELPQARLQPGDDVPITLYLRAQGDVEAAYQLFIQLLDDSGRAIANVTTHPGWGRNPTTLWEAGALYADRYLLRIDGPVDAHAPLLARVYTGFIDPATEAHEKRPLPAQDGAGNPVTPFAGTIAISPREAPTAESLALDQVGATFGGVIRIEGACLAQEGEQLTARLLYEATGTPAADYTAFVHLLDENGARVAGYDRAPAAERFPTSAWRAGDRIAATFALELPDGESGAELTVWTGLYETASDGARRLPVTDAAGRESGDGQIALGPAFQRCRE